MHILLIRHAESVNNEILHKNPDIDEQDFKDKKVRFPSITQVGLKQSQEVALKLLDKFDVDKTNVDVNVRCSMMTRAFETARWTAKYLNCRLVCDKIFNEYDRHGEETLQEARERIKTVIESFVDEAKECNDDDVLIVFGHSQFISLLLSRIISEGKNDSVVLKFPNTSISSVHVNGETGEFKVHQIANVEHLSVKTGCHLII